MAVFALPVWNLQSPLFSAMSISHKRMEILAIWQHFGKFLAIFSLCLHRNGYLWASGQNS